MNHQRNRDYDKVLDGPIFGNEVLAPADPLRGPVDVVPAEEITQRLQDLIRQIKQFGARVNNGFAAIEGPLEELEDDLELVKEKTEGLLERDKDIGKEDELGGLWDSADWWATDVDSDSDESF
ncbi:OLC1v1036155C1 [Oldenlandia corymbosa var. corymbosa]|uniref:OLC1v1036155C1 n=1 Tax=Oldenlandia corymbosa var. corymbosa TaxID=529605 RepID=A0AAV1CW22_OLDCO|nr:OLC1v1036155C1 [Oldenlandia corymbosa var. corymbosa]